MTYVLIIMLITAGGTSIVVEAERSKP